MLLLLLRTLCVVPRLHENIIVYYHHFSYSFSKMFNTGEIVLLLKSHDGKMVCRWPTLYILSKMLHKIHFSLENLLSKRFRTFFWSNFLRKFICWECFIFFCSERKFNSSFSRCGKRYFLGLDIIWAFRDTQVTENWGGITRKLYLRRLYLGCTGFLFWWVANKHSA